MRHPWSDPEAAGAARGGAAVLDRPDPLASEGVPEPESLAPCAERRREVVIAFPGTQALDESVGSLLADLVMDFLDEAPRHGYRAIVLVCDEEAPFRPILEKEVERATQVGEIDEVRLATEAERIDLFLALQRAVGHGRGAAEHLANQVIARPGASILVVAPDGEQGHLFHWSLDGFLESERREASVEFVQEPPETGAGLRIAKRMFRILRHEGRGRQTLGLS